MIELGVTDAVDDLLLQRYCLPIYAICDLTSFEFLNISTIWQFVYCPSPFCLKTDLILV